MRVLVLDVPALHLGYLGCYGNDWAPTPGLDRLAAEGVVFDQHYADCLDPTPSPWTGCYHWPPEGATCAPGVHRLLADVLAAHGMLWMHVDATTVATSDAEAFTDLERTLEGVLGAIQRIPARASGVVWAELPGLYPPWRAPAAFLSRYLDRESTLAGAGEESLSPLRTAPVGSIDPEDFLLWERVQLTYAGAVAYVDSGLQRLVEELGRRRLLDQMALILTSRRGLALGEHGIIGDCRPWLHEEVIHLPLILRLPGAEHAGRRVGALTQPVDLCPTILDVMDVAAPKLHGNSLLPATDGDVAGGRAYTFSGWWLGGEREWAIRTPQWAFLLPTGPASPREAQLYLKPEDRWEVNNVAQQHPDLCAGLQQVVKDFVGACCQRGSLVPPALPNEEGGQPSPG